MVSWMNDGINVSLYNGYYEIEEHVDNFISEQIEAVEYTAQVTNQRSGSRHVSKKLKDGKTHDRTTSPIRSV